MLAFLFDENGLHFVSASPNPNIEMSFTFKKIYLQFLKWLMIACTASECLPHPPTVPVGRHASSRCTIAWARARSRSSVRDAAASMALRERERDRER